LTLTIRFISGDDEVVNTVSLERKRSDITGEAKDGSMISSLSFSHDTKKRAAITAITAAFANLIFVEILITEIYLKRSTCFLAVFSYGF
jgi:hypothetical protein